MAKEPNKSLKYNIKGDARRDLTREMHDLTKDFVQVRKTDQEANPPVSSPEEPMIPQPRPAEEPKIAIPPYRSGKSIAQEPFRFPLFVSRGVLIRGGVAALVLIVLGVVLHRLDYSIFTSEITDIEIRMSIKHRVIYNIMGQVREEEVIVDAGGRQVVLPITLQRWMTMSKEQKYGEIRRFDAEAGQGGGGAK